MQSFTADGSGHLVLGYRICGETAESFRIGVYRSADTSLDAGDELLDHVEIDAALDRARGAHSVVLPIGGREGQVALPGAGAKEMSADYHLLAVADPLDLIVEADDHPFHEDNTTIFAGAYLSTRGCLFVHGTEKADVVDISAGTASVETNGAVYARAADHVTRVLIRAHQGNDTIRFQRRDGDVAAPSLVIQFWGGPGSDSTELIGSDGNEEVSVAPHLATMNGPDYRLELRDVASTTVHAGGGSDVAFLYDDPETADEFTATPKSARLEGDAFCSQVLGFRYVHAHATPGEDDVALLHDDPETADEFLVTPERARLRGDAFFSQAFGFRYVHAYATPGENDVALLHDDAETADKLLATPKRALLYGDAFFCQASGFRYVHAFATPGGGDEAELSGSASDDVLVGTPNSVRLEGGGFYYRVCSFQRVDAQADQGGYDRARLHDGKGDDLIEAGEDWARLSSRAPELDYVYDLLGFEAVRAEATEGRNTRNFSLAPEFLELIGDWKLHVPDWTDKTSYLEAVIQFLDTMVREGTDRYGTEHSPMFSSILGVDSHQLPEIAPPLLPGQRKADRSFPGGNLYHDMLTLLTMYYVSEWWEQDHYAEAADAYLEFFLGRAAPVGNGLFPAGEHAYWDFHQETVAYPVHEDLGLLPAEFLDRLWEINPEAVERHIQALERHIADPERWYWNRHAPILDERAASIMSIPRHGGFYIYQWSYLFTKTGDPTLLDWAQKTGEVHWAQRHPETGNMPYYVEGDPVRSSDADKAEVVIPHVLALGQAMLRANQLLGEEALARFDEIGGTYVHSALHSAPHDPAAGLVLKRIYADGSPYEGEAAETYGFWDDLYSSSGGYGFAGVEKFAVQFLNVHRLTGSAEHLQFARDVWDFYQTQAPQADARITPGKYAGLIALSLDLHDLTGEGQYLNYAREMGDRAVAELHYNGLFRAASGADYYEAANGAGALALELLRLHLAVTGSGCELPRNYWDP